MTIGIQGGVRTTDGASIPTKKQLKLLAEATPEAVEFYDTAAYDKVLDRPLNLTQLATDTRLYVVGPDPYNKRSWYAQINRMTDGRLKVT